MKHKFVELRGLDKQGNTAASGILINGRFIGFAGFVDFTAWLAMDNKTLSSLAEDFWVKDLTQKQWRKRAQKKFGVARFVKIIHWKR